MAAPDTGTSVETGRFAHLYQELCAYYGIVPALALFGLGFAMCFCYSSQRLACNIFDGWFQIA